MLEQDPISVIKGVGPQKVLALSQIGITTVRDLLEYFPSSYEDRGTYTDVTEQLVGKKILTKAVFTGKSATQYVNRRKNVTRLGFVQHDLIFDAVFYNQPYRKNHFTSGQEYLLYGAVSQRNGAVFLSSPECEKSGQPIYLREGIAPVYRLPSKSGITKKIFHGYLTDALNQVCMTDEIPFWIHTDYEIPDKFSACRDIHFPQKKEDIISAMRYFRCVRFLQFFLLVDSLKKNKKENKAKILRSSALESWLRSLEYELTPAQKRVVGEIAADLKSGYQMNRLLQGDVGSGKTAVAMAAVYLCAKCACQAVFAAPTEILAKQHYQKYHDRLLSFGIESVLLYSSLSAKDRRDAVSNIQDGAAHVIFGTHAVFSEDVHYANLALIVVDEQHRFGVSQRAKLEAKGLFPHVLVMSATPIPRTLALSMYRDLNLSILDSMPSGRKSVKTMVCDSAQSDLIDKMMVKEIRAGHKCYFVCPAAEDESMQNVAQLYGEMKRKFPKLKLRALTGSTPEADKDAIMNDFAYGDVMALVATTVIEVGVDVPNATVIVVKDSERFGLAQLHQLRGRVGRSELQSYCILQSDSTSEAAMERLNLLSRSNDGFEIAQADMHSRGAGELFGLKQSGKTNNMIYEALENEELFFAAERILSVLKQSSSERDKEFLTWLEKGIKNVDDEIVLN